MTTQATTEKVRIQDFYPTPSSLIYKLLEGVKLDDVEHVLEPSAGRGDIADHIIERTKYSNRRMKVDCIEINPDLQHILRGKDHNLIQDDFLTFETRKAYDLIVANFPFSEGDAHLAKAIQILETSGGQLRCIVNAETIKNPHTRLRQIVNSSLEKLGADVQFLSSEFVDADRKTNVEIALIKVDAEKESGFSVLLDTLKKSSEVEAEENEEQGLVEADFMRALIARFNTECAIGVKLIEEYFNLKPYLKNRISRKAGEDYSSPLIELQIKGAYSTKKSHINAYLEGVRNKYWELLIHDPRFSGCYTSNVLRELNEKLTELRNCDFNLFNIQELEKEMRSKIGRGVEEAIVKMFDEFSRKHSYGEGFEDGNIHYYNGWKTNKAHKINEKVILPINGFSSWKFDKKDRLEYYIRERLNDIVKVFNYLSDTKTDVPQLVGGAIEHADKFQEFKGMDLRYFETTFYKKGTCHIKFKDQRLLDKFNIFGSQRKGWLPPSYGKKAYAEMNQEEKAIIDDFQGKEKYDEILKDSGYYLVETNQLLLEA